MPHSCSGSPRTLSSGIAAQVSRTRDVAIREPVTIATVTRVAVLDDCQRRAAGFADWASLGPQVESTFSPSQSRGTARQRLADYEVLVRMRERTRFDEDALVSTLKDGTIAGAGLDVYDAEPVRTLPAGSD